MSNYDVMNDTILWKICGCNAPRCGCNLGYPLRASGCPLHARGYLLHAVGYPLQTLGYPLCTGGNPQPVVGCPVCIHMWMPSRKIQWVTRCRQWVTRCLASPSPCTLHIAHPSGCIVGVGRHLHYSSLRQPSLLLLLIFGASHQSHTIEIWCSAPGLAAHTIDTWCSSLRQPSVLLVFGPHRR